ncbi:hypothetical protein RHGRI_026238 [Rhododendron griersonianum]|uniref:Uncharacterized protein n=1 Tax=Rhododendron griersonianum TaxID=479676 RepID=A0AAV6IS54_9ERIC|nr:hypothetical protein RHGRI_026238 [Rhododendron griersonianum]
MTLVPPTIFARKGKAEQALTLEEGQGRGQGRGRGRGWQEVGGEEDVVVEPHVDVREDEAHADVWKDERESDALMYMELYCCIYFGHFLAMGYGLPFRGGL